MRRLTAIALPSQDLVLAILASAALGCGPLAPTPLPPRLTATDQRTIDEAWNRALEQPRTLDRQGLLDILLLSQAYQVGVDRISFRSEKETAHGKVVMLVEFERGRPERDRFEVQFYDSASGTLTRRESFDRESIERTYAAFGRRLDELRARREQRLATSDELAELAAITARLDAAKARMPDFASARR